MERQTWQFSNGWQLFDLGSVNTIIPTVSVEILNDGTALTANAVINKEMQSNLSVRVTFSDELDDNQNLNDFISVSGARLGNFSIR